MASGREGADQTDQVTPDDTSIREITPPGGSSDGEGSERTTREKLKKTSIAGLQQHSKSVTDGATGEHPLAESISIDQVQPPKENGGLRGRPSKKRSFEDLQKDEHAGPTENGAAGLPDPKRGYHKRMRSRDVVHGDDSAEVGKLEEMGSPVQEESDDDANLSPGGPGVLVDVNSQTDANAQENRSFEEKMLEEDNARGPTVSIGSEVVTTARVAELESKADPSTEAASQNQDSSASAISSTSAFANTSLSSPFGNVKSLMHPPKDPPSEALPATTSSAFASSGLSAFASSQKSPFDAAGTARPSSGFGSGVGVGFGGATSTGFGSGSAGFGGSSAFGAKSSGFGGGSGFGPATGFGSSLAPKPFGTGISSFASPAGASSTFGKAKPFGAKDDDDDEEGEEGDDGDDKAEQGDDTRQDSRFHEQSLETGEEEEDILFTARARLYHFEKEWKERGTGNIKINSRWEQKVLAETEEKEDEQQDLENGAMTSMVRKARVIMRADGVHRVILNSPVFKDMKVGTNEGKEPSGKTMYLTGLEDGQPRLFQIKIGKEDVLKDLYYKIQDLKDELE